MVDWSIQKRLMEAFPGSFINHHGELVVSKVGNVYICLEDCTTEKHVQCKLLEWCSRAASKALIYRTDVANRKYQDRIRNGINRFMGTEFTREDMADIYQYLGNGVRQGLTLDFIESGFDMAVLRGWP